MNTVEIPAEKFKKTPSLGIIPTDNLTRYWYTIALDA
jgi:hypothetical protein